MAKKGREDKAAASETDLSKLSPGDQLLFEHYRANTPINQITAEYSEVMGKAYFESSVKGRLTMLKAKYPLIAAKMQPSPVTSPSTNKPTGDALATASSQHETGYHLASPSTQLRSVLTPAQGLKGKKRTDQDEQDDDTNPDPL